jgi:hypothetical protein
MEASMPLTFDNRSRAMIAPRGVMAFAARDGRKEVCCLLPLLLLESSFDGATTPDALGRAFDRHRDLIEESASELYDRDGSDECGEILLTELDLRRRS